VTTEKVKSDILNLGWRSTADISVALLGSTWSRQSVSTHDLPRISLLYVSTVEPRKGHDILLDAFDLLLAQGEDVDLTLVGHEGWMVTDLVDRISRHDEFGSRLKWYRGIPDEEVRNLAREANIGVMPSRGEGFGLFIEEGLTLGLKVVASAIPEFLERSQPNLSFFGGSARSLADAIVQAHETPYIEYSTPRSMRDFSYDLSVIVEQAMSKTND
jgi:glycosyltransferase involved in cell wall biosynthesis